jgi:thiamine-phosphate pyrophosphorylase
VSSYSRQLLGGLYVILDPDALNGRSLVDGLKEAAGAGARLFQYRDKAASAKNAYRRATQLQQAAADVGALFLVNDRCDLALAIGADGVHLGQDDLPLPPARVIMGPDRLIGISTHTAAQVIEATAQGADYLGVGPIFATTTKPDHEPVVGVDGLAMIRRLTPLRIFAIGGIRPETVESVIKAGAHGVAVISAIWNASDVAAEVERFIGCLRTSNPPVRQ